MPVTASSFVLEGAQADDSHWCRETHQTTRGDVVFYYLAAPGSDGNAIMAARVASVNAQLADAEEAANYANDGAPSLAEMTAAQFAARLRAKYKATTQSGACQMAYWLLRRIAAGQITDAQCQSAFGVTSAQWTTFKTNTLTPQSNAWAAVISATGS